MIEKRGSYSKRINSFKELLCIISRGKISMTEEQKNRKEIGWLVYGILIGGILSVMINLWTSYFMKYLEQTGRSDWGYLLITSSIALCIIFGLLWYFYKKLIAK
jgi:Kef-type K+ transport system membrane component KefB